MSYVDLKHLLADLTLETARNPGGAQWAAVALACAELATPEHPQIAVQVCLSRARALAGSFDRQPATDDITRLVRAGLLKRAGDVLVVPARFVPYLDYCKRQSARVLAAAADLRTAASPLDVGIALFNAGLFFECHEWLEGIWKATTDASRDFYHGIIQVAAAFYHFEKRNRHGSRTLLEKGLWRLRPYPDAYLDVELARLKTDLAPWAAHFTGGPRPAGYPRIAHKERGSSAGVTG